MTIERMIELLEIEHECMLRGAHDDCDRKCADCELVQEDDELHEMYTNVVQLLKEQEAKKVTWRVGRAHCPSCGELFPKKQDKQYIRFCNYCGQAVKWE